jgi:hypothetical protein
MTIPLLVQAKRARTRLRQLASNLAAVAASKSEAAPVRETARELEAGLRAAAAILEQAEADAIAARDRAYVAAQRPRPSARAAHPWDARAVPPRRPKGVQ